MGIKDRTFEYEGGTMDQSWQRTFHKLQLKKMFHQPPEQILEKEVNCIIHFDRCLEFFYYILDKNTNNEIMQLCFDVFQFIFIPLFCQLLRTIIYLFI